MNKTLPNTPSNASSLIASQYNKKSRTTYNPPRSLTPPLLSKSYESNVEKIVKISPTGPKSGLSRIFR